MKTRQLYTFILGILFLFPQFSVGQDWFKEGAQWVFRYNEHWGYAGFEEVSITGDTIIENKICKIFERNRTVINHWDTNSDTFYFELNPLIMYEKNDSVYFYFEDEFTLCYDFTMTPDNGYVCFGYQNEDSPQFCSDDAICYVVTDTGNLIINGVTRRYQDCSSFNPISEWGDNFRIIEGIGKINSDEQNNGLFRGGYIFLPLDYNCFWDSDEWSFCAYSDKEITYKHDEEEDCYFLQNIVNVKEIDPTNSKISITPNPFQDFIQIQTEDNLQIQIFDSQGKVVFKEKNVTQQLNLSALSNGVYFILLETSEGSFSQKMVK